MKKLLVVIVAFHITSCDVPVISNNPHGVDSTSVKVDTTLADTTDKVAAMEAYNDSLKIQKLIKKHQVEIGMTKAQCRKSWGRPEEINVTTTAYGRHEQWVYNMRSYLYFDDGILTSIQN